MRELRRRLQYAFARNGTLIALGVLVLFFYVENSRFVGWDNIKTIGQAVSELGVMAFPLALLVISGAVDLSVGSVASMAGILGAKVMVSSGSTTLGIGVGLVFGCGAGALNGILVSYLNLNAIVVTIGALAVWAGMAEYITGGETVAGLPNSFTHLGEIVYGVPIGVYVLAAAGVVCWFILNRLPYGRHLYAVGGNERATFLMGVPVRRVRFFMFVQVGAAAALSGLMIASKLAAADPIAGQGMEINALTVVLLGGVAFAGGTGRVSGVVAGLFFVGALQNGLVVTGVSQFLQQVFVGLTLIAAVALDDTLRKFVRRSWAEKPAAGSGGPPQPAAAAATPSGLAELADTPQ